MLPVKTNVSIRKLLLIIMFVAMARSSIADMSSPDTIKGTKIPKNSLILCLIDPNGNPVEGAKVGSWTDWSDTRPAPKRAQMRFAGQPTAVLSQDDGIVILRDRRLFENIGDRASVPLYVFHESEKIGALAQVSRKDLGQKMGLKLRPVCHVKGYITSNDLEKCGQELNTTFAFIKWNDLRPFECKSNKKQFNFYLPPGQYVLLAYGEGTQNVYREIEIKAGQQKLDLQIDLPINKLASLFGQPAPEFQKIKGWINGKPMAVKDLRGKVILLDFWAYWCIPCINKMPKLIDLYKEFKDQGLAVIAIHNDSIASIEQLDKKLEVITEKQLGREIPFPIALDGGGKTPIIGTSVIAYGATTAAYGVTCFPTTLLIDRQGILVQEFDLENINDIADLEHLLNVKTDWRVRFRQVYSLKENQALKRIAPSLVELRRKMLNEPNDEYPYTLFQWAKKLHVRENRPVFRKVTLQDILERIVGLSRFDYCCPDKLLSLEIPGDWIVRKGASKGEKLRDLEEIISKNSARLVHFEKRQIVRDVIVANGVFKFKPLSGTFNDTYVHVFSDKLDTDERGGGGRGSLNQFLIQLGSVVLNKQIVNLVNQSKKVGDIKIGWFWHLSGYLKKLPEGPDKAAKLSLLLNNLSSQTSLSFSKEQQHVDVWYVIENDHKDETIE